MTIDLMALAKKADETYLDVETTFGILRVYHVPDVALLSGTSVFAEPDMPTVLMKTATGTQERPAKKGDIGFDEWQIEVAEIREKQFNIRRAKGFVLALRDEIDWSKLDITLPPPVRLAQDQYRNSWPEDETLRKMIWLDFTIFTVRDDKSKVTEAMNIMNQEYEPTDEMVEEVKKSSVSSSEQNQEN